ncbi:MAG: biotin--[acetyl-CoA-carboxylase] ligase [Bacteroidetes bacterium]|nr:MAG: biotin--[acetyl-CoA-carboxylase] ligase [Bacteroidota bacterium]REK00351.1 MAG: biotin--[acetyl-CoA-carboxylase] ligase [Bacteroidota bacterium]REK35470.1 MAG: biotin--[acetyl-CoA-carboxylase] ligase [Bacteroidota bacterium]REK46846.1 MAG: biotin--[acetyl-CoA-carboxylase] ligase [Bacteroidota bacterium]
MSSSLKDLTTLFTARDYRYFRELDSTNSYLAELLKNQDLAEGTLIRASYQHAGRGQTGESWSSREDSNLLISILFYPVFIPVRELFILNMAFALGVTDYLKFRINQEEIKIKWPNDIYAGDEKICGMLIENSINTKGVQHTILGIGLNVNQEIFPEHVPNPVSMKLISGKEYVLDEELAVLCSFLEARYLQLKNSNQSKIKDDYLSAMYRIGEEHDFVSGREVFRGRIIGVEEGGKLQVKKQDGNTIAYGLKEIRFADKPA